MNRATPLVVIDVVGLTPALLGTHTPNLNRLAANGFVTHLEGVFPALTTTAQATMLTGLAPAAHGIVGNGWYFRDTAEVRFWLQSNHLVGGEKVWETLRRADATFRCAKLFWWYNMYASVDLSLTPRPIYPADGRKLAALYSQPPTLHTQIESALGPFPFFSFWGPQAGIRSSEWIAAAAAWLFEQQRPDLTLVYLPHLDYNLQRLGPDHPDIGHDVAGIDAVAGELINTVRAAGAAVLVVSEYGITAVTDCIDINRILRAAGLLAVRETLGWELLDPGASRAFAVADHQIAHVYVSDPADCRQVADLLTTVPGIEHVLGREAQAPLGIDHARAGELIAIAARDHWFSYYYWLNDRRAPDFARTVDIHRKPGYDPVELFLDPAIRSPRLKIAWRLLKKRLGMRMLMDVIPLRPELVKGSHGRLADSPNDGPLLISSEAHRDTAPSGMRAVRDLILDHFGALDLDSEAPPPSGRMQQHRQ